MQVTGEWLRARRKALGLTLEAVGRDAGITRHRIGDFEAGRRRITLRMALRMAAVLQMTPEEVLNGT